MNSVILLTALCAVAIQAKPSLPPLPVNPGGIGGLFRGPNLETIIKGPDGSQITSEQIGGAVQTEAKLEPIVVPELVGDQVAISSPIAPLRIEASPAPISLQSDIAVNSVRPIETVPIDVEAPIPIATVPVLASPGEPHIIETELVDAPEVEPDQSSDLKGPSGTISVRGSASIVSGPASTTISEPVRKIEVATIHVQTVGVPTVQAVAVPSVQTIAAPTVQAIQPAALPNIQSVAPLQPATIGTPQIAVHPISPPTYLTPPAQNSVNYFQAGPSPTISTDLIPPSATGAQTPLISLGGTSGAGIADAAVRQNLPIPVLPSTQVPLVTQNGIDLRQSVVTSTQSPISISPSADIDASRINLGASQILNTNLAVLNTQRDISSTGSPIILNQAPLISSDISADRLSSLSSTPRISIPQAIGLTNVKGPVELQNEAILTNQIVSTTPSYTSIDERDVISSQDQVNIREQSRPLLNIGLPSQHFVSSTALPPLAQRTQNQNLGPIASVLDTVLVEPTDPRNREVIEFGGRQLENVGNIVPVVRQPVLLPVGLNNIQHIPTASVSQLSSRNELDSSIYGRYGRDTTKKIR
ncbi:hypothetical protein HHI36_010113 [Cryptolaemus montrouzieri]|uniref:Uncharacterized protein n=1 Tax=Cryptolaemus montrouzieri TaxID=559131 RepID=A0ABD2MHU5_9CUCU